MLRDRGDRKYNDESHLGDVLKAALNPIASVKIPKSLQKANEVALKLSPGGEGIKKAQEFLGTDKELSVAPIDLVGLGVGGKAVKAGARVVGREADIASRAAKRTAKELKDVREFNQIRKRPTDNKTKGRLIVGPNGKPMKINMPKMAGKPTRIDRIKAAVAKRRDTPERVLNKAERQAKREMRPMAKTANQRLSAQLAKKQARAKYLRLTHGGKVDFGSGSWDSARQAILHSFDELEAAYAQAKTPQEQDRILTQMEELKKLFQKSGTAELYGGGRVRRVKSRYKENSQIMRMKRADQDDIARYRVGGLKRLIKNERDRIIYNRSRTPRAVHPESETPEFAQRHAPRWLPKRQQHKYETDEELITQLSSREYMKARYDKDAYKDPFGDHEKWIDQAAKDGAFTPKEAAIRKKRVAKRRAAELRRQSGKKSISNALYNRRLSRERQASKKAGQKDAKLDRAINERELAAERARDYDDATELYYDTVLPAHKAYDELKKQLAEFYEDDPEAYFDVMRRSIDDAAPSEEGARIMSERLDEEYRQYMEPFFRRMNRDNGPDFKQGPYGDMDP